ncbi:uncharacterized protein BDW43DRAFT_295724 [Aspergillus alliaceus]|uniref:uncharacterized protein n=1 Tax=Petromyces alliaceus TaxID=209559 RepID=UPI0012A42C09|nr:uncharacterized protein BDW43DRAFT_295724 [Aspergillus alliaceus]KAB8226808.1 hypothetical protein BDW43DRAFT_295724 [Aspergillus alliaceus]
MARNFLSVAVSGVGVKSLFNTSHDICYYRRSRLDPKTIHGLIILLIADRFQLRKDCQIEKKESDNISDIYNYLKQPGDKDHFEYISDKEKHAQFHKDNSEDDIQGPETLGYRRQSRYGAQAVNYRALAGYQIYNT